MRRRDDRISSDEAPIPKPYFQDIYGTSWEARPDTIIRREIQKLQLNEDVYWKVEGFITNRKWPDLLDYLTQLERRTSGDDQRRLEKAREETMKVIRKEKRDSAEEIANE